MNSRTLGRERICWKTHMHIYPHRFAFSPESIPPHSSIMARHDVHLSAVRFFIRCTDERAAPSCLTGTPGKERVSPQASNGVLFVFFFLVKCYNCRSTPSNPPSAHLRTQIPASQPASQRARKTTSKKAHAATTHPPPQILPESSPKSPPPKREEKKTKLHYFFSVTSWTGRRPTPSWPAGPRGPS